jgi:hypothetical protein
MIDMAHGEIDKFPVSQLPSRYDLARSAVYKRMDQLGIVPEKVGQRSYLTAPQIKLMDELHRFIQQGGNAAEFIEARGLKRKSPGSNGGNGVAVNGNSSDLANVPPDLGNFISGIVSEVVSRLGVFPEPDRLAYFERLESAAQNGWLPSTSEIAELLDIPPGEIERQGESFAEAGFVFRRAGRRRNGETAWRVTKRRK